ncbi:Tetratricopeptide repeat protein [Stieleria neptunia]|uniref:Tetratricopeptide repeat protein n=1 Tax=Stieleria neptunia TaxID=2527979 RepID=A0A518HYC0_9BACT|nr:tetratricopeptide repeat protein [Stieleria neptunia]QDV45767.1 Tetratricopeptide repeat protein [Stieleria neptunia]
MNHNVTHPPAPRNAPRISLAKRLLFSLVLCFALFGIAELLLACFWDPPPPTDPFVGFSPSVPLLVEDERSDPNGDATEPGLRINPAKLVWFNDQSFPASKPAGTYRIVCLGGSTTFGRPFDDSTSFCGWLRTLLPLVGPQRQWEVINAGGVSYASYRVAGVMQEFAGHDVDLFILYTGQNEFLEWRTYGDLIESSETPGVPAARALSTLATKTRVGQSIELLVDRLRSTGHQDSKQILSGEVDEILNHTIGPASYQRNPSWHRGVEEHFRINLRRMQQIAQGAGAALAVVVPASNLRDCSPFKADFGDGIDGPTRQRLTQDLETARELLADGAAAQALEVLELILEQDQVHADVHFLRGRALLEVGLANDAANSFQRAIDEDICPLRATTPIKQILREFLSESSVIPVDFEAHLAARSQREQGHVCFGAESFLDHVHPTVDVHREIALAIVRSLADRAIVPATPTDRQIVAAAEEVRSNIDRRAQAVAFRNLAKLTHWAGKFEEARRNADDALRLLPLDLESRYILADCLVHEGQIDAAIEQYTELFEIGDFDRACRPFGELLAMQGHTDAAKGYLMQAVFVSQGLRQAAAYESLGRLHESLGENELAAECFEKASQLRQ